jgi:hypothetical protein
MRGGAAVIEQAGFGQNESAGTDAGDARAAFRDSPYKRQRMLASRRGIHPLASRDDQGADRAIGF